MIIRPYGGATKQCGLVELSRSGIELR